LLFFEAAGLYEMAINITKPVEFVFSFTFLLSVDTIWVLYIMFRKWKKEVPSEWLWLNFYVFTLFFMFLFLGKLHITVLAIIATSRTVTDYYVARQFYIPGKVKTESQI